MKLRRRELQPSSWRPTEASRPTKWTSSNTESLNPDRVIFLAQRVEQSFRYTFEPEHQHIGRVLSESCNTSRMTEENPHIRHVAVHYNTKHKHWIKSVCKVYTNTKSMISRSNLWVVLWLNIRGEFENVWQWIKMDLSTESFNVGLHMWGLNADETQVLKCNWHQLHPVIRKLENHLTGY